MIFRYNKDEDNSPKTLDDKTSQLSTVEYNNGSRNTKLFNCTCKWKLVLQQFLHALGKQSAEITMNLLLCMSNI